MLRGFGTLIRFSPFTFRLVTRATRACGRTVRRSERTNVVANVKAFHQRSL